MSLIDVALDCIRRGWHVFPCYPRSKMPMTPHGFKDATTNEDQIQTWWAREPDANVAIATGPSGLCVLDIDDGASPLEPLHIHGERLPLTYAVRTGRRPEYGIQLYYSGVGLKSTGWERDGLRGDIRCSTGYVLAAGSIHPSGETYRALNSWEIFPVPDVVRSLTVRANDPNGAEAVSDNLTDGWKTWLLDYIDENRIELRGYEKRAPNGWWLGIHCPWESEHGSGAGAESSTVLGILDGKIAFECSHGTCKAAKRDTAAFIRWCSVAPSVLGGEPGAEPKVTLGTGLPAPKPADWRYLFHSKQDVVNCPPPQFLIKDFLAQQSICAIAAPVAQRKSLIALNIAHSLCTGRALFDFLPVEHKPKRVLYLCPEMGLISLSERVMHAGLTDYIGDTLFLRSMNLGNLSVADIPEEALQDSVLILDTAIRFMQGDEQSAKDMKVFSDVLFAAQRKQGPTGAIVVLYHSPKTTKEAFELTLENCLRGSGELGAAVTDAHGTRLQDPEKGWDSDSFISHVKARDYPGVDDFTVRCCRETGLMTRTGEAGVKAVLNTKKPGAKPNKDGLDDAARAFIKAHTELTVPALIHGLEDLGIKRRKTWVTEVRLELRGGGSTLEG